MKVHVYSHCITGCPIYNVISCDCHMHTGCYGVPEEDGVDDGRSSLSSFTTVPWFCDACKAGIDPTKCVSQQ